MSILQNKILYISFTVVFFFAANGVAKDKQVSLGVFLQEELQNNVANSPNLYSYWVTDELHRENLFELVFLKANLPDPVDNRTYLFSLAIDLYNSLPPGQDATGFNDGEISGKGMMYKYISQALFYDKAEQKYRWKLAVEKNSEIRKEREFVKHWIRINVRFDNFAQQGSKPATDIDLTNPTYYRPMQRWMAENATAMAEGVAPWEAVTWATEHRQEWATVVTSPIAATTQAVTGAEEASPPLHLRGDGGLKPPTDVTKTEVSPTQPEAPTKEQPTAPAVPWWLWVAGGVVVVVGGLAAYTAGRRKKK